MDQPSTSTERHEEAQNLSVRAVVVDYYMMHKPPERWKRPSGIRTTFASKQPVIRVFGPSQNGQKACLHIHGVFPYFLVSCPVNFPTDDFLLQFAESIDAALNLSFRLSKKKRSPETEIPEKNNQYVHDVIWTHAYSFYGYHSKQDSFLKIMFLDPYVTKRAADLLLGGSIMNTKLQPFESHVPFIPKFFIDYNIFGMDWVKAENLSIGAEVEVQANPSLRDQRSLCAVEAYCQAEDILNPRTIASSVFTNPGLEFIWKDDNKRRGRHSSADFSQLKNFQDKDVKSETVDRSAHKVHERLEEIIGIISSQKTPTKDGDTPSPALSDAVTIDEDAVQDITIQFEDESSPELEGVLESLQESMYPGPSSAPEVSAVGEGGSSEGVERPSPSSTPRCFSLDQSLQGDPEPDPAEEEPEAEENEEILLSQSATCFDTKAKTENVTISQTDGASRVYFAAPKRKRSFTRPNRPVKRLNSKISTFSRFRTPQRRKTIRTHGLLYELPKCKRTTMEPDSTLPPSTLGGSASSRLKRVRSRCRKKKRCIGFEKKCDCLHCSAPLLSSEDEMFDPIEQRQRRRKNPRKRSTLTNGTSPTLKSAHESGDFSDALLDETVREFKEDVRAKVTEIDLTQPTRSCMGNSSAKKAHNVKRNSKHVPRRNDHTVPVKPNELQSRLNEDVILDVEEETGPLIDRLKIQSPLSNRQESHKVSNGFVWRKLCHNNDVHSVKIDSKIDCTRLNNARLILERVEAIKESQDVIEESTNRIQEAEEQDSYDELHLALSSTGETSDEHEKEETRQTGKIANTESPIGCKLSNTSCRNNDLPVDEDPGSQTEYDSSEELRNIHAIPSETAIKTPEPTITTPEDCRRTHPPPDEDSTPPTNLLLNVSVHDTAETSETNNNSKPKEMNEQNLANSEKCHRRQAPPQSAVVGEENTVNPENGNVFGFLKKILSDSRQSQRNSGNEQTESSEILKEKRNSSNDKKPATPSITPAELVTKLNKKGIAFAKRSAPLPPSSSGSDTKKSKSLGKKYSKSVVENSAAKVNSKRKSSSSSAKTNEKRKLDPSQVKAHIEKLSCTPVDEFDLELQVSADEDETETQKNLLPGMGANDGETGPENSGTQSYKSSSASFNESQGRVSRLVVPINESTDPNIQTLQSIHNDASWTETTSSHDSFMTINAADQNLNTYRVQDPNLPPFERSIPDPTLADSYHPFQSVELCGLSNTTGLAHHGDEGAFHKIQNDMHNLANPEPWTNDFPEGHSHHQLNFTSIEPSNQDVSFVSEYPLDMDSAHQQFYAPRAEPVACSNDDFTQKLTGLETGEIERLLDNLNSGHTEAGNVTYVYQVSQDESGNQILSGQAIEPSTSHHVEEGIDGTMIGTQVSEIPTHQDEGSYPTSQYVVGQEIPVGGQRIIIQPEDPYSQVQVHNLQLVRRHPSVHDNHQNGQDEAAQAVLGLESQDLQDNEEQQQQQGCVSLGELQENFYPQPNHYNAVCVVDEELLSQAWKSSGRGDQEPTPQDYQSFLIQVVKNTIEQNGFNSSSADQGGSEDQTEAPGYATGEGHPDNPWTQFAQEFANFQADEESEYVPDSSDSEDKDPEFVPPSFPPPKKTRGRPRGRPRGSVGRGARNPHWGRQPEEPSITPLDLSQLMNKAIPVLQGQGDPTDVQEAEQDLLLLRQCIQSKLMNLNRSKKQHTPTGFTQKERECRDFCNSLVSNWKDPNEDYQDPYISSMLPSPPEYGSNSNYSNPPTPNYVPNYPTSNARAEMNPLHPSGVGGKSPRTPGSPSQPRGRGRGRGRGSRRGDSYRPRGSRSRGTRARGRPRGSRGGSFIQPHYPHPYFDNREQHGHTHAAPFQGEGSPSAIVTSTTSLGDSDSQSIGNASPHIGGPPKFGSEGRTMSDDPGKSEPTLSWHNTSFSSSPLTAAHIEAPTTGQPFTATNSFPESLPEPEHPIISSDSQFLEDDSEFCRFIGAPHVALVSQDDQPVEDAGDIQPSIKSPIHFAPAEEKTLPKIAKESRPKTHKHRVSKLRIKLKPPRKRKKSSSEQKNRKSQSELFDPSASASRDDDEPMWTVTSAVLEYKTKELSNITVRRESIVGDRSSNHDRRAAKTSSVGQNISLFSLELHVQQREGFAPDPTRDPIIGIFYSVFHDDAEQEGYITGVLWNGDIMDSHVHYEGIEQVTAATESDLFPILVQVVRRHDPDILVGYDIQPLSWGYILERADAIGYSLASLLSRVPGEKTGSQFSNEEHWWSMSEVKIVGRTVLNLWRILRHEMALRSYTFENVMYHFLNIRLPEYSHRFLSELALLSISRPRFIHYYQERVERPLDLIRDCNILNRTVEMAKLYGIQFYDVLSRGSQFRVENMMLRMTRRQNYVAPSPSPQQRSQMASPKMIALTMEPISRYYKDPVVVLDFTSLYPSICIAYNICYSTCLGKIEKFLQLPGEIELGCLKLGLSSKELRSLKDDVHVTPAGVAFVQKNVRRGVIPSMLEQILETRAMIKRRMKENKKNKELLRVLDARQLALKLIANVTYGYTSANFSGRMPCVEIADSIVHQARETLENAIKLVNSTEKWGATVVYGDTDSLFVHLPGKSKAEAFIIGEEMIRAVGDANPEPINLKFEKVYQPCFLQTKKRYAGYAYETPDQIDPILDAKGIESVRRDGCPVASKILETSLKVLFENRGRFDPVKMYLSQEISKVLSGRMSLRNFLIAREFRGRGGYKPGAVVPALKIARARSQRDPRSEPQMKERVAYVISAGPPGATLYSCVREPEDFIRNPSLKVNYGYYVRGQIVPAMNRMFNLMGQDVSKWLEKMPHDIDSTPGLDPILPGKPLPPSRPFAPRYCPLCEQLSTSGKFCLECQSNPMETSVTLRARIQKLERKLDAIHRVCMACTGSLESSDIHCISMACPMYLKRAGLSHSLKTQIQPLWTLLDF